MQLHANDFSLRLLGMDNDKLAPDHLLAPFEANRYLAHPQLGIMPCPSRIVIN
jgi:hypothetical protein